MRGLLILLSFCFFIPVGHGQGVYELKVTSKTHQAGLAILSYRDQSDTVALKKGVAVFKGKAAQPTEAHLLLQPGLDLPIQLVLEKGKIFVKEEKEIFVLGGTANNNSLQQIKEQLNPFSNEIKRLREQSFSEKDAQQKATQKQLEEVQEQRRAAANNLILSSADYAGLVTAKYYYLKQTAKDISNYLKVLSTYATDPIYAEIQAYYQAMNKAEVGNKVAPFTLTDIQGKSIALADYRGKFVLLDFWFHNCGFCRQMIPDLKKIYAAYGEKNLAIVSISVDSKRLEKEWRQAVAEDNAPWTQLWDPEKSLESLYGVQGYPTLFLLDQNGVLLQKIVGYHNEEQFRTLLDKYIK